MNNPVELGYFTISVMDIDRAKTFYGALFGWEFTAEGHAGYAHVGNTKLPFGLVAGTPGDLTHLYFRVDDAEAMAARVRELGGDADAIAATASGLGAACRGDQGTAFSIWQAAPGY
jgi:predicted enzyme related to lactoylglutathione lyase